MFKKISNLSLLVLFLLISKVGVSHEVNHVNLLANDWIEELKHITIIRNKCDNIDSAIEKLTIQRKYESELFPNKQFSKCGKHEDGTLGCISLNRSFEEFEENLSVLAEDEKWNELAIKIWADCGIDYFGFERETILFD